jgi:uncharacterized membrane protein
MSAVATSARMRLRGFEPLVALALGAAALAIAVVLPSPLRAIVALPIALLLPGYALLLAAFGDARERDGVATAALGAALSISLYPLVALSLFALSIRLSTTSVLVATEIVVLALGVVAGVRTRPGRENERADEGPGGTVLVGVLGGIPLLRLRPARSASGLPVPAGPEASPWRGARGGLLFAGLVGAACAIVALGLHVFPGAPADGYTQLSLAGSQLKHAGAPFVAGPGRRARVDITVSNHSSEAVTYRLSATVRGTASWHGRAVTVVAHGTWTGSVQGSVPAGGCLHRLLVDLRRDGESVASLTLWLQDRKQLPKGCQA